MTTDDAHACAEIDRLWGSLTAARLSLKTRQTAREIAAAAILLADEGGLEAVSMRSVARAVGMSAMGLYTYFPGKSALIELMIDEAYRALPLSYDGCLGWRDRLGRVARDNRELILRHQWLATVEGHRPVLGPNVIAKYDFELGSIEGIGLDDVTMDLVLSTLLAFVNGAARAKLDAAATIQRTGQSDAAWWSARAPLLAERIGEMYPLAQRVGAAAGLHHDAPSNPEAAFDFGLERFLDGIERLLVRSSAFRSSE
jgi:AcrR family transcriptional regulator